MVFPKHDDSLTGNRCKSEGTRLTLALLSLSSVKILSSIVWLLGGEIRPVDDGEASQCPSFDADHSRIETQRGRDVIHFYICVVNSHCFLFSVYRIPMEDRSSHFGRDLHSRIHLSLLHPVLHRSRFQTQVSSTTCVCQAQCP